MVTGRQGEQGPVGFQRLIRVFGRRDAPAPQPQTPQPQAQADSDLRQAFDAEFYRGQFPGAGLGDTDPLLHYLDSGWREGRDPAPWFSTSAYLAAYGDVREAGMNPLVHYLRYGRWEGRSAGVRRSWVRRRWRSSRGMTGPET